MTWKNEAAQAKAFFSRHSLGMALLLGLSLRLIGLESRSLQYDDVFSIFLARRTLVEILSGTAADTMPPLYYFLLHFWMMFAEQAWFIRLLSVILTLATIFLVYRTGKHWFDRESAGWAALLAAISPLLIYHGQDVRMYALLVTAQMGYLWFFTRVWERTNRHEPASWSWVGFVVCGVAAMYSHNVAILGLVVPDIFLLIRRRWALLIRLIAAQLLIGVLAMPWLLLLPGQIAKVQKAWTLPIPGIVEVLQAVVMFTASLPLPVPLLALTLLCSLQILVMVGFELRRAWREAPECRPGTGLLLVLFVIPPMLLFIASYLMKPVFIPRAFLVSSLALDLLAGFVIARTWSRGVGKLVFLAFFLAAALSLPSHYTYAEFPRSPYQAAVNYLGGVIEPGERVIHETKLSYFPASFYAPGLEQVFLADPAGSPNDTFEIGSQKAMQISPQADMTSATGNSTGEVCGIYFITYRQVFREYEQAGMKDNPNLHWLEDHYRLVERKVIGDLEIYHFRH